MCGVAMSPAPRSLVALNGSPVRGSSIDLLLQAVCAGAEDAGGVTQHIYCGELKAIPCQACGPDPAPGGCCVYHDDMDRVYAALEGAHAIVVGSPIYFDAVSAQLKLVMDRCNCITPLVATPDGGWTFRPKWERTRRAVFVTACGERNRWDMAERSVRGFLKWVGAKWEETLVYAHADNDAGSVAGQADLMEKARAVGRRLVEGDALVSPGEP